MKPFLIGSILGGWFSAGLLAVVGIILIRYSTRRILAEHSSSLPTYCRSRDRRDRFGAQLAQLHNLVKRVRGRVSVSRPRSLLASVASRGSRRAMPGGSRTLHTHSSAWRQRMAVGPGCGRTPLAFVRAHFNTIAGMVLAVGLIVAVVILWGLMP